MRMVIIYKIDIKNQEQNNNKNHIVNFYTIFLLIIIIDKKSVRPHQETLAKRLIHRYVW